MKKKVGVTLIVVGFFLLVFSFSFWPKKTTTLSLQTSIEGAKQDPAETSEGEGSAKDESTGPVFEEEKAEIFSGFSEEAKQEKNWSAEKKSPDVETEKIENRLVSWGFQKKSDRSIDAVIIHSSYNSLGGDIYSLDKILKIYQDYGVSPHYIIDRTGKIYRLVEDQNVAYHAGESRMPDGRKNVNDFSIGIEMINSQEDPPSAAQYASLQSLLAHLNDRYEIRYVLGHSDIAPGRKTDPWKFDWEKID